MGDLVQLDDGYGSPVDKHHLMPAKPGSHAAYARGSDLVVEWYDFGSHGPYESANLLIFDRTAQAQLAELMGCTLEAPCHLAQDICQRFESYFDVRRFADEGSVAYRHKVDFNP